MLSLKTLSLRSQMQPQEKRDAIRDFNDPDADVNIKVGQVQQRRTAGRREANRMANGQNGPHQWLSEPIQAGPRGSQICLRCLSAHVRKGTIHDHRV